MAVLTVLSVILCEAVARLGAGPLRLWRDANLNALEEFGLGLLLGWSFLGVAFLGLALAGLFYVPVLLALFLGLLCFSSGFWRPRVLSIAAVLSAREIGTPALAALGLVAVPLLPYFFALGVGIDAYVYHLGIPWQYLQAHRVLLDHVPVAFHLPALADLDFSLALIFKDERLARWIIGSFFLAASAVWAGRALVRGNRVAAWLGPLLALSSLYVPRLLTMTKNDLPAAALLVAGAAVQGSSSWFLAATLFGFALSAKVIYAPVVLTWWVVHPPPVRRLGWVALLLLLPSLPWWAKSFLATGNPVYPVASTLFPSLGWGPLNEAAFLTFMKDLWGGYMLRLVDLPSAVFAYLCHEQILVALALPALLIWSRRRRSFVAGVLGAAAVLAVGNVHRYALPCSWLLCALAASEAARFPAVKGRLFVWMILGFTLLRLGTHPLVPHLSWKEAMAPPDRKAKELLTTFHDVNEALSALAPRRVISVGEFRTYRVPARVLYAGVLGETPLLWKLTRESHTVPELAKRVRQLGATVLLHNFVSMEWMFKGYLWFPWEARSLSLYTKFCKRHLSVLQAPERCDGANGGFYLYAIRASPLSPSPDYTFFVPGAGWVSYLAKAYRDAGRIQDAAREYRKLFRTAPSVGQFYNELAAGYASAGNWAEAFQLLKPFVDYGMIDAVNLPAYGEAAVNLGRLDLAEEVLRECLTRYPGTRHANTVNLGVVFLERGRRELAKGRLNQAERFLKRATALLLLVPSIGEPGVVVPRRQSLAQITGLKGDLAARRGRTEEARQLYREALELAPNLTEAREWRQRTHAHAAEQD